MKFLTRSYLILVYAFFYIPVLTLIVYSFNDSQYSMIWHGFTWAWYAQLFAHKSLWISAWHSLFLGFFAAMIATAFGAIAAVSLYRYRFFGRKLLYLVLFILIVSPDIVLGTSLLVLFSSIQLHLGFFSLLIAHITFCLPYVIIVIYGRLTTFDKYIFEAAKDLGATDLMIFTKIIVPLLFPGLLAAWLLSFTLSIDDVIVSYFIAGPGFQILPLEIYSMVKHGVNPEINALTTIILIITFILVMIAQLSLKKKP
jgi:spermidine/putrescine transport system permease protein